MHCFKRNSFLLLLFSFFCNTVFCQQAVVKPIVDKNSRTSLKLYAGYVIPVGEFAELSDNDYNSYNTSTDYTDFNIIGAANRGISTGLVIAYRITDFFRIGLQSDYSSINTQPTNFRDLFDLDSLTEISYLSTTENWETVTSMIAFSGNLSHKKWNVSLSLMAGVQFAWSPAAKLYRKVPETGTFNGVDAFHVTYSQPGRDDLSPCIGVTGLIGYELTKKIRLELSGSYQTSNHDFDEGTPFGYYSTITSSQGVVNTVNTVRNFNFSKKISYCTISIGVSIALGR